MRRRIETPTTFASRSRERDAAEAARIAAGGLPAGQPVLVYMGTSQRTMQAGSRGEIRVDDVELYVEQAHTARRWFRWRPHGVLTPMFDNSSPGDEVTKLRPMKTKPRFDGSYPAALPEPPPQPV